MKRSSRVELTQYRPDFSPWTSEFGDNPEHCGDTAPLVFMLLPLFFWVHSLVTVKRLRDAGLPAWHYVFYVFGPIAWLALVGPSTKSGAVILVGFVAIFVLPGFYKSKPDPAAEAKAV